ncbi:hypothetical protein ACSBR1_020822 [Camellia fascicularis]
MTWVFSSKKHMGMRKLLACLSLLLLMLIELETPCFAELSRFKGRSDSKMNSLKPHNKGFKGNADKNGEDDDAFGAQKRKVYTGPNPLHNR